MTDDISLTTTQTNKLQTPLEIVGAVANQYAGQQSVADYLARKSPKTIRAHANALALFGNYLNAAGDASDSMWVPSRPESPCYRAFLLVRAVRRTVGAVRTAVPTTPDASQERAL